MSHRQSYTVPLLQRYSHAVLVHIHANANTRAVVMHTGVYTHTRMQAQFVACPAPAVALKTGVAFVQW